MGTPVHRPTSAAALVLASASPRRLALLQQIGIEPDSVAAPAVDARARAGEPPLALARRLAVAKARTVAERHPGCFVLAADTVVALGRRVLPKAEDATQAAACLALLSGRRHRVIGAIALVAPDGRLVLRVVDTRVAFKRLSPAEIESYIASGEWRGKAGGYAIQGRAAAYVRWINGSYSNVVGLALFETAQLLVGAGAMVAGLKSAPSDADV